MSKIYRLTTAELKHLDKYKFVKKNKEEEGYWTPKASGGEKLPELIVVDCFDCPKRKSKYCSFYLSTCRFAKRFCTICVMCKSANWINSYYKECEGCIIEYEKGKELKYLKGIIN